MMNYGEWYANLNSRYKKWFSKYRSRTHMENALLYGIPSIVLIIMGVIPHLNS